MPTRKEGMRGKPERKHFVSLDEDYELPTPPKKKSKMNPKANKEKKDVTIHKEG